MATIKLTDDLGLDVAIKTESFSAFGKYFRALPGLIASGDGLRKALDLTLGECPTGSLRIGLAVMDDASGAGASITVSREDECCVSFEIDGRAGVSAGHTFGAEAGAAIRFANRRKFPETTKVREALERVIGGFTIPARAEDLRNIPRDLEATVGATGTLRFTASANLLAISNPLASLKLPDPIPAVGVTAGGSVEVSASVELTGEYEVVVEGTAAGHVNLTWRGERSKALAIGVTASGGVAGGIGERDLFGAILTAISANPKVDAAELRDLPEEQAEAIESAVKAAAARRIELAMSAEASAASSAGEAFVYDVDPAAAAEGPAARAIAQALAGDLTLLEDHAGALAGVARVRSIWTKTRERALTLKVNLLGVLNSISVSNLVKSGTALYDHEDGSLTLTDRINAERVKATTLNFGADSVKLRRVLADAVLLTLVYSGARNAINRPALSCTQSFWDVKAKTSRNDVRDRLLIGIALGAVDSGVALPDAGDFGRTVVSAQASYDDAAATALFLNGGAPRTVEEYETAGRTALQLLVSPDGQDAARRRPAVNDDLWREMKSRGPTGFGVLFPRVPSPIFGAITADYLTIRWWADAMTGAAKKLAEMRNLFPNGPVQADDPKFVALRESLKDHMANVARKTTEEFGQPWGLVATYLMSGGRAPAQFTLTSALVNLPAPAITTAAITRS